MKKPYTVSYQTRDGIAYKNYTWGLNPDDVAASLLSKDCVIESIIPGHIWNFGRGDVDLTSQDWLNKWLDNN